MKILTPLLMTIASASFAAGATAETAPEPAAATQAASDGTDETPERRPTGGHSKAAFFESYDMDGDGRVTEAEFMGERETGYARRDADGDGDVHAEEYVSEYEVRLLAELEERRARQIEQANVRFGVLDTDENGILSLEEFHASGQRIFSALDTNEDGVVNEADEKESY